MRYTRQLISSISLALLASCGDSGSSAIKQPAIDAPNANQCLQRDRNQAWFEFLQESYLWNDTLPASIDPEAYATTNELLQALKAPQDRFSFVVPSEEWNDRIEGNAFGYGMRLDFSESTEYIRVVYVFADTGADNAGIERADRITSLNGVSATQLREWIIAGDSRYAETLGPDEDGYQISATWLKPDGEEVEETLTKGDITTNTVMATQVLTTNAGEVGYLSFQQGFLEPSGAELDQAFSLLNDAEVGELILDLRHNGGGRVDVAARLAAYIAGDKVDNQTFVNFVYNDEITAQLESDDNLSELRMRFSNELNDGNLPGAVNYNQVIANSLNLSRVYILTTDETCSASESAINALRPYIDVYTLGSATCGKPVGMVPAELCEETMLAINFQTTNADGFGDYFDGIEPNCSVNDERVIAPWGDLADPSVAAAVTLLETGSCPATSSSDGYKLESSQRGLMVK